MLDRGGADHHALNSDIEQSLRRLGAPHSPADLDPAGHGGGDRRHHLEVGRFTGPGRVEVDDVDPARAVRFEATRDRDGILVVDGLGREVAAQEAHRVPVPQVDGREEVYSAPFVEGSSALSTRTASRRQRATPLNDASITWCPFLPESDRRCSVIPAANAKPRQNSSASCGSNVPIHSATGSTS